jgi:hypothetical protein
VVPLRGTPTMKMASGPERSGSPADVPLAPATSRSEDIMPVEVPVLSPSAAGSTVRSNRRAHDIGCYEPSRSWGHSRIDDRA